MMKTNRMTNLLKFALVINVIVHSGFAAEENGNYIPSSRIVNGTDANLGENPWQGLFYVPTSGRICGCSLISSEWAITAAHCTEGVNASETVLVFGANDLRTLSASGQAIGVSEFVDHPEYINSNRHDISLLRLDGEVSLNANVQPVTIPYRETVVSDGTLCNITGWGTLSSGGAQPDILQQASVPIVNQAQCDTWLTSTIYPDVICAGYEDGGVDTCQGDSGGPLVCYDNALSTHVLQGITSYGFGCARPRSPGVYARVSAYTDWIYNNTGIETLLPTTLPSTAGITTSMITTNLPSTTTETTNLLPIETTITITANNDVTPTNKPTTNVPEAETSATTEVDMTTTAPGIETLLPTTSPSTAGITTSMITTNLPSTTTETTNPLPIETTITTTANNDVTPTNKPTTNVPEAETSATTEVDKTTTVPDSSTTTSPPATTQSAGSAIKPIMNLLLLLLSIVIQLEL